MELLFWAAFGGVIGYAAAERRGFSTVAGILGGVILGPLLAWLLFFVSGVARAGEQRKCSFCAEHVKREALVCKHCGRDIQVAANS